MPTDGGSGSAQVVTHAAGLAAETGATLHALHVINESEYDVVVEETTEARKVRREAGEQVLDQVVDVAEERGVDVETKLCRAVPDRAIVERAGELDADLIVMGTHGRRGLERFLLGSVTDHVLRAADHPVLAVKLDATVVPDEEAAECAARDVIAAEDADVAELREDPDRERTTWIVRIRTGDGRRVNVHADGVSGETRVAHLD